MLLKKPSKVKIFLTEGPMQPLVNLSKSLSYQTAVLVLIVSCEISKYDHLNILKCKYLQIHSDLNSIIPLKSGKAFVHLYFNHLRQFAD